MNFDQFKAMVDYEDVFGIPGQDGKPVGISPIIKTFTAEQQRELTETAASRKRTIHHAPLIVHSEAPSSYALVVISGLIYLMALWLILFL